MKHLILPLVLAFCFPVLVADGQDAWPQWRGPNLDNVSTATDLPVEFNRDNNMHWRYEMPGPGGASPVVFGDKLFTTSVVDETDGLSLICLGTDGQLQWQVELKGKNRNVRMDQANSASASPCTDGQHVWATTAAGFLQCFDMQGNEVWSRDLQDAYGEFQIQFGMSSTPVLFDGKLYLQLIHGRMRDRSSTSEGTVVAMDASSGDEIWAQQRKTDGYAENKHSYASPTIVHDGEHSCLVTHGGDYAIGHSLEDGKELWRCGGLNPKGSGYNPYLRFVASPVFADGCLVIPSAKNGPVFAMNASLKGDVTEDGDAFQWKLTQGTPDVATPLVHNGLVFLARENGVLLCVDAKTGEEVYEKRMYADRHRSTPVYADGKIYLVARDGTVLVVAGDRTGEVLARNELDEDAKSSPAIAGGRIYIRTEEALYCFGK